MASNDLSQLQAFLNLHQQQQQGQPAVASPTDPETAGMDFAQLFSHYLAPEVAKLPPSSANMSDATAPEPFTFGGEALSSAASTSAATSFDPSAFMPTIPGSPIGAFSPSTASDGMSTGRSPMSFPDLSLDFGTADDQFAIDPSIFDAPAVSSTAGTSVASASPEALFGPGVSESLSFSLGNVAELPPLPQFPLAPLTFSEPAPTAVEQFLAPLPPAPVVPAVSAQPATTASGRPKRNVATLVIPEEDEDDLYSSDGSVASTATAATANRKSTRAKKPAAKKARGSSEGLADGGSAKPKKLPKTSVQPLASDTLHRTTAKSQLPPVPQWADKPDAEEYAKLSSKEKRQLRNKLSARNFRHRRKEYITTLEEEISTRDTLISSLKDEVGVIRAENTGLRSEVATLKEKWQDLLDKLSNMAGTTPAPAPANGTATAGLGVNPSRAMAAAAAAAQSAPAIKQEDADWPLDASSSNTVASTSRSRISTRSSSSVQLPNLSKDVGALGRRFGAGFGANGFMPVHTTFVPDLGAQLAEGLNPKPAMSSLPMNPFSTQSFNPALNALSASGQLNDLPSFTSHLRSSPSSASPVDQDQPAGPKGTFEDFFASNPYWLRPDALDASRAALYGKLANNAAGLVQAQKLQQQQQRDSSASPSSASSSSGNEEYLPLPAGFRPAFFRSSSMGGKSATNSELLAFQSPSTAAALSQSSSSSSSLPVPVSHQDALALRSSQQQQAAFGVLAGMAQKTLLQRMSSAFFEAFSGSSSSTSQVGLGGADRKGKQPELSTEKVLAVLRGTSRVEVVPVGVGEEGKKVKEVEDLGVALSGLDLGGGSARTTREVCGFEEAVSRARWTAPPVAVKKEEA
ncbi:hypothetical protein JCM8547_001154 [Rhodosporidiobolus lusitaniae]